MQKVSIIIPVFNVEKYLTRCLDSVVNQTLDNIEIICINDCSTDNSLDVLKKYALKDNRIKLIDLPQNRGVSFARNTGIDNANGEYIAFLDPDDWWNKNLLKTVYTDIQTYNSEIAIFGSNFCKNDKIIPNETQLSYILQFKEQHALRTYQNNLVNYAWDKLYNRDFINRHKIRFNENLSQTEDVIFALECFSYNPTMSFIPKNLYNYQINREGSAMTKNQELVSKQIIAFKTLVQCDFFINANDDYKQFCLNIILGGLVYFYVYTTKKKFSLSNFLELRKFMQYIKSSIPLSLLDANNEYKILNDITAVNLDKGVSCLKK